MSVADSFAHARDGVLDREVARTRWYPVATSHDLAPRHVYQGRLLGRELALWRADDGSINAWENRCLHRGVRLSIGINDGRELVCRYHGWRYANRSAACTYIPAHPADAPARTIRNTTYPVRERGGLVWVAEAPLGEPPDLDAAFGETPVALRAVTIAASLGRVRNALPATWEGGSIASVPRTVEALFLLQPIDAGRTCVRGLVRAARADVPTLRAHDASLSALRRRLEVEPAPPPYTVDFPRVDPALAGVPVRDARAGAESVPLRLRVARLEPTAADVLELELAPLDGADPLPTALPGAHIDLHLPNALVRQYSLANASGTTDTWVLGVQRAPASRGGSEWIHDRLRVGDVLGASLPRDGFTLRRDASDTLFVAGGIGVTALAPMALALQRAGLGLRFAHFARTVDHFAFTAALAPLGERVERLAGLTPEATRTAIAERLGSHGLGRQVYACGPPALVEAVRELASSAGWPDEAVHFEYFANPRAPDTEGGFDVALARSGIDMHVPSGTTLLQALRGRGVAVPASCEQGACGTCRVRVIDGHIDHRDVWLNATERRAGNVMTCCVSRGRGRLTLDL